MQTKRVGPTTVHVPYAERICTLCQVSADDNTGAPVVQDEPHLLFECPGLQHIRAKYMGTCLHAHMSDNTAVRISELFDHDDAFQYVHDIMCVLRDTVPEP